MVIPAMFEFIRTHRRFLQFVLLILILPSFAFFGIQSYSTMGGDQNAIAKIGRESVSDAALENAMRERIDQVRAQFGSNVDAKLIDTPEARKAMLDQLINQRVLSAEVTKSTIVASDQAVRELVSAIPVLQKDGKFDYEKYKSLLSQQGMNEAIFETRMRADIANARVTEALTSSEIIPTTSVDAFIRANETPVQVQEMLFKPADYTARVSVTPEALKVYYDAHRKDFEVAEKINAEYVVLNAEAVGKTVEIKPDDLKTFYEQNKARYRVDEQRRASHILLAVDKKASDGDRKKIRDEAEAILAAVRKDPASFARVAKEKSQDTISAAKGGDLDFFGKGAMVKPFEDAVFALKQGDISDVVQSDFGYHIIQLTGIKPEVIKPFEEVRGEIEAEYRKTQIARKFPELAEQFSNTVYEQGDSLKAVADKLKLTIGKVEGLTRARANAPAKPDDPVAPKVITALFSADSIKSRKNTEAIEVAPNTLVAARILDYQAAMIPEFDKVQAQVQANYTAAQAIKLAMEAGKAKEAELVKNPAEETGFAAAKKVSRAAPQGTEAAALRAIVRTAAGKLPAAVGVDLGATGYAVYRVIALEPLAEVTAAKRLTASPGLARALSEAEVQGLMEDLRARHKVKILKTSFERKDPDASAAATVPGTSK